MTDTMLTDAAERMFADLCDKAMLDAAEDGAFPSALWNTVAESGFHQLAMPDSGVSLGDAFAVVGIAGRHALPLPLAETLLANRWLAGSDGLATIGQVQDGWIVDAPWGRAADRILGLDAERGACVVVELGEGVQVREGANLAGEPRDAVALPDGAEWLPLLEPAPGRFVKTSIPEVLGEAEDDEAAE